MSYSSWFKQHGNKHRIIVDRLIAEGLSEEEIIDYFDFDNMVSKEPEFCYLYPDNKKCHNVESLNCYLCACPLFRFSDDGIGKKDLKVIYSECYVNSKLGIQSDFGEAVHLDCSGCTVPHGRKYVRKNYDTNWYKIMEKCNVGKKTD